MSDSHQRTPNHNFASQLDAFKTSSSNPSQKQRSNNDYESYNGRSQYENRPVQQAAQRSLPPPPAAPVSVSVAPARGGMGRGLDNRPAWMTAKDGPAAPSSSSFSSSIPPPNTQPIQQQPQQQQQRPPPQRLNNLPPRQSQQSRPHPSTRDSESTLNPSVLTPSSQYQIAPSSIKRRSNSNFFVLEGQGGDARVEVYREVVDEDVGMDDFTLPGDEGDDDDEEEKERLASEERAKRKRRREGIAAAKKKGGVDEPRGKESIIASVVRDSVPSANDDNGDKAMASDVDAFLSSSVTKTPPAPAPSEFDMFSDSPPFPNDPSNPSLSLPSLSSNANLESTDDSGTLVDNWDDGEGYYKTRVGDMVSNRYIVKSTLGRGVFASVVRCTDSLGEYGLVAVKVIRNNEIMMRAAKKEVKILEDLRKTDPRDRKFIVRLIDSSEHRGHSTMVFENLALNLRETLNKFGRGVGINIQAVRSYAKQLVTALQHLSKHKVVHADIKPDNILVSEDYRLLKLCDFGSAFYESDSDANQPTPYLVSRFYRPPEVILGLEYGRSIDLWAVGVTLFEIYAGKVMFPGATNGEMLRRFMDVKGCIPNKIIRRHLASYEKMGLEGKEHFWEVEGGGFSFVERGVDKVSGKPIVKYVKINPPVKNVTGVLMSSVGKGGKGQERTEVMKLGEMIEKILNLDGGKRVGVGEISECSFLSEKVKEEVKPYKAAEGGGGGKDKVRER